LPNSIEPFEALTNAQKSAEVTEFDEEFVFERARPLTAAQSRDWNKFRKNAAQPARDGDTRG
jgi:hypothetical protein